MWSVEAAFSPVFKCLSATANRQLLRQVGDDLHRFYAVPAEEFITKARHLSVLKDDAVMLDGYYREGEPLRLGLGLYPGERIRQPVLRAIRDWRPPEQKMDVTASLPVQTVRLDSMSLFDVGQARLKDGSTKVLVDALVNIRAKPGWLILVAGYTDATGDEKSNQQLSLRRAEAVGYQCYLRGHIRRIGVRRGRIVRQFLDFIAQAVQFADNVGHFAHLTLRLVLRVGADKDAFLCPYCTPQIGTQFKTFPALLFPGIHQMTEVELALAAVLGTDLDMLFAALIVEADFVVRRGA